MTGLIDFSTDAASNGAAAPPILWQEGQPANTVNDSARQLMAALARWRDDNSGVLAVGGGASGAITLGTNQTFTAAHFASAFEVAFRSGEANAGPCTLNIDGSGARPLRRPGGFSLAPSDIVPGRVYRARWTPDLPYYVLVGPELSGPGEIRAFATEQSLPPGWLIADGRALSRTAYDGLLSVIGTSYGPGNGSTTFNIPDLRGRTLFGEDRGANRLTGTGGLAGGITATGGAETVTLSTEQMPQHSHGGSTGSGGGSAATATGEAGGHDHGGSTNGGGGHTHGASSDAAGAHAHSGSTGTAGSHTHEQGYQVGTAGSGATNRVMTDLQPTGTENGIGINKPSGSHSHPFDTNSAGDHSHQVNIAGVGDHSHGIPGAPNHTHSVPAIAAHTHPLTIDPAGSGAAHANVPPGAVVIWAIRA